MKFFLIISILVYSSFVPLKAQFYFQDPAVTDGFITPNPPTGLNDEIDIKFLMGNNGFDSISGKDASQQMSFSLEMRKCSPSIGAVASDIGTDALSGTALDFFDLTYDAVLNSFTATQKLGVSIEGMGAFDLTVHAIITELSVTEIDNSIGAILTIFPNEGSNGFNNTENDYVERLTHTAILLPIQLISFTGSADDCNARLVWKSEMEESFSHFDVEYSADGSTYTIVKTVLGKNSKVSNTYNAVIPQPDPEGYYRLKMVDIDNRYKYSRNVLVRTQCSTSRITVSPNPAVNDKITVRGLVGKSSIQLFNVDGKQLSVTITAHPAQEIDLSAYAAGIYIIHVTQANKNVQYFRIVKK